MSLNLLEYDAIHQRNVCDHGYLARYTPSSSELVWKYGYPLDVVVLRGAEDVAARLSITGDVDKYMSRLGLLGNFGHSCRVLAKAEHEVVLSKSDMYPLARDWNAALAMITSVQGAGLSEKAWDYKKHGERDRVKALYFYDKNVYDNHRLKFTRPVFTTSNLSQFAVAPLNHVEVDPVAVQKLNDADYDAVNSVLSQDMKFTEFVVEYMSGSESTYRPVPRKLNRSVATAQFHLVHSSMFNEDVFSGYLQKVRVEMDPIVEVD